MTSLTFDCMCVEFMLEPNGLIIRLKDALRSMVHDPTCDRDTYQDFLQVGIGNKVIVLRFVP